MICGIAKNALQDVKCLGQGIITAIANVMCLNVSMMEMTAIQSQKKIALKDVKVIRSMMGNVSKNALFQIAIMMVKIAILIVLTNARKNTQEIQYAIKSAITKLATGTTVTVTYVLKDAHLHGSKMGSVTKLVIQQLAHMTAEIA